MLRRIALAALLAFATVAGAAAAEPYEIDGSHTQVQFTYNHLGFSNITGRFDKVEGEFLFDADDPTRSRIAVTIPIDSISTGVDKLDQHLQAADFFDVAQFPTASFQSSRVESVGEGRLRMEGELSIHGVTRPVSFEVTVNKVGEHPMRKVPAAGFDAVATIKRSDFGLGAYVPAVSDEVTLRITLEAVKAK